MFRFRKEILAAIHCIRFRYNSVRWADRILLQKTKKDKVVFDNKCPFVYASIAPISEQKTFQIKISSLISGTLKSRFSAHIGIPINYLYDKISDIERSSIKAKDKEIDWSSSDGKNLQESLVLSEMEQVFGMASSILLLKTHKLLLTSLYPAICLLAMYGAGQYFNRKLNLYVKPLAVSGKLELFLRVQKIL